VVLTLRTGQSAPDAITALWKDGHLARLELQPLSEDETAALVEARLGAPLDSTAAHRLWSVTRGNVLYLRQLVDGELEAGRLRQVTGMWRWSGSPKLSPGLAELLSARIGELPDAQRDVIDVLALGEPLGIPLLARLTDAAAVEHVEARGLIDVYPDGQRLQARLGHPLYGEVQREQMGRLHARRLRGRIADALAATGGRRAGDTLRWALLALDSDLAPDPPLLTDAARHATELGDLALAERIARAAVTAGGGFEPRLLLGNALHWSGSHRGTEAETELAAVAALARTDAERVQAAIPRMFNLAWLGRAAEAEAMVAAVTSTLSSDAAVLDLASGWSVLDGFGGRAVKAAEAAAKVLADPRRSPTAVQLATWATAIAGGGLGRLAELSEKIKWIDARTEAYEIGLHQAAVIGSSWVRAMLLAGWLDEPDQVARRHREQCRDIPGIGDGVTSAMRGAVAACRGQVKTAARWFRQALASGTDTGMPVFTLLVDLPGVLAMAGVAALARHALDDLDAARHHGLVYLEPELLLTRAWVAAAEGSVTEATVLAHQAAELAAAQDQSAVEVVALHTAVCFGDRTVADRLAKLATQVDGPRAPAAAAHAAALAADDGTALQAASIQLETMGALLLAADAAAHAATAHHRHGQRGSAQAATTRAHRLAQACEDARTPALTALATPLPLTAREREIVTLAANGLSNRQIADKLTVSVRTVEGHLYRACAKLGISDRGELAPLVRGN
jgi:ATP/maltotriose-dependent transcriptional regulator MalT